jgi:hypothetical protein
VDGVRDAERTNGVAPLWRDVLAQHAHKPLHLLVGGGDQLYQDAVFGGPLLKGWDKAMDSVGPGCVRYEPAGTRDVAAMAVESLARRDSVPFST